MTAFDPVTDNQPSGLGQRNLPLALGALIVLLALKAFALGASGSVAVLASVIETVLETASVAGLALLSRWGQRRGTSVAQLARAQAAVALILVGLGLAGALVAGGLGLMQILEPRTVSRSWLAIMAMGLALLLVVVGVALGRTSIPRPSILADPAPTFVAGLGMAAASWLSAPGLDGAAAIVIAVWLAWGAVSQIRPALMTLLQPFTPDPEDTLNAPLVHPPTSGSDSSSVPFTDDRS